MSDFKDLDDQIDAVAEEIEEASRSISRAEGAIAKLSRFVDRMQFGAHGTVRECLEYGLVTIEAKYGASSNEANHIRKLISNGS